MTGKHAKPDVRPRGLDVAGVLEWIRANSSEVANPNHPDPCLVWNRGRYERGYGKIKVSGRDHRVHKFVWEALNGPVPDGLVLDHEACDNPPCWQVSHLVPKTDAENVLRGGGPPAQNARRTHCKRGHPLSGENLALKSRPNGSVERVCRTCRRERNQADWQRKAAS